MRAFHSLLILLFFSVPALAQQALADSVSKILQQKEIHDTVKAYNLVMLAMYTEPLDINKAHTLYKEAVDFSLPGNWIIMPEWHCITRPLLI